MKVLELATELKKIYDLHGDIDVMLTADGDTFAISSVRFKQAEDGEFPKDWNMPEGFKFINTRSW
jgi:hypothetical protein